VAKAKALRKYVEPLITKSKSDTTHNRRTVFSYLKNKEAVTELFREVSPKIADRPGGYVRIIRLGFRPGDNAEMAMIELVDFNAIYGKDAEKAATAKKRTRRAGAKKKEEGETTGAVASTEVATEEEVKPKAKRATKKKSEDNSAE
jgi:large subunit ribosomal protein L17